MKSLNKNALIFTITYQDSSWAPPIQRKKNVVFFLFWHLGPRGLKGPRWCPSSGPHGPQRPQLGPYFWAPVASWAPVGALDLGPRGLKGPSWGHLHKKKIERHMHDYNYINNKRIKNDDTKVGSGRRRRRRRWRRRRRRRRRSQLKLWGVVADSIEIISRR